MNDTRYESVLEALGAILAFLREHGGTFWVPILLGLMRDLKAAKPPAREAVYRRTRSGLFGKTGSLADLRFEDLVDGRLVLNRQRTSMFKQLMKALDKALAPDY